MHVPSHIPTNKLRGVSQWRSVTPPKMPPSLLPIRPNVGRLHGLMIMPSRNLSLVCHFHVSTILSPMTNILLTVSFFWMNRSLTYPHIALSPSFFCPLLEFALHAWRCLTRSHPQVLIRTHPQHIIILLVLHISRLRSQVFSSRSANAHLVSLCLIRIVVPLVIPCLLQATPLPQAWYLVLDPM